jgi:hypothetical protein
MLETIISASKMDERLAGLVDEAREYAQIYLLARQRHKGCDGTGELLTLKEEFKDVVDKMILYCKKNNQLSSDCDYDTDSFADALVKINGK